MSESINQSELFVTLGRVEAKVDALSSIDGRLRKVEQDVHTLKENQGRKAPWWVIVSVIGVVIGGAAGIVSLLAFLAKMTEALSGIGV